MGDIIGGQGPKYGVLSWGHIGGQGPTCGVLSWGNNWGPGAEIWGPFRGTLLGARGKMMWNF